MKKLLFIFLLTISAPIVFAQGKTLAINHFEIRQNNYASNEVVVVATDTAGHVLENITGVFNFTMNGFQDTLKFENGVAFYKHKIDKSTFLYAKHQNESGTHGILYYIYNHNDKLTPLHISWILLLAIPCGLFLLAYMFKRFIIVAIIIFVIFMFFNYHNNLSIPTFFESIIDGLKNIF
ncbi:hypothetical protein KXD93_19135 [Mucilaginibacter sp. BJC16-A38]|uniref:hypothetical protein n=1 Tax=Mucilaginibacter phenanthrenivorans TaxID=1234842 RepID=UPI00215890BF|nr:hypothetical protein [Mucilaginibacter phenanthrenivorans]MCR8559773.1 hypothetical protein [Mucilaginibacter phenanthrenivorans]